MVPGFPYNSQLTEFVFLCRSAFGENLTGVYLHGSSVLGCFHPTGSDMDLLVVTEDEPAADAKISFMDGLLPLSEQLPCKGIETSVIPRYACDPVVHPMPFFLHFSEGPGNRDLYRKDPAAYFGKMRGTDRDLAAHAAVTKAFGICLFGLPVDTVFGEVSREDYADAILYDVEHAEEEIGTAPVYLTLNLCRGLAFLREGRILSKAEGGEWGAEHLLPGFRPWIREALSAYWTGTVTESADTATAKAFARYMLGLIRTCLPQSYGNLSDR